MTDPGQETLELAEESPVGLLKADIGGVVRAHNRALALRLGIPAHRAHGALRGQNFVDWLMPASRAIYENRVTQRLIDLGRVREIILEARDTGGGPRPFMLNAELRRTTSGEHMVFAAMMDASERIEFERRLVQAQRAAEIAQDRLALLQETTSRLAVADGIDDLGETLVAAAARATRASWAAARIVHEVTPGADAGLGVWGTPPTGLRFAERFKAHPEQLVYRSADEILARNPDAAALVAAGVNAAVVTPILRTDGTGTRVLGELHCWFGQEGAFEAQALETLQALAAQAELVVDHLRLQERVRHRAMHDGLTGLPNRALLEERLTKIVAAQQGTARGAVSQGCAVSRGCAVLFIDLDGFKPINDRLGHAVGDQVLREVATRLRGTCRTGETVSRLGGDEFVIAADRLGPEDAAGLAARVLDAVALPLVGEASGFPLSCSIGVAHWDPARGSRPPSAEELVAEADAAMYEAKRNGKNGVVLREWGLR